MAVITMSRQLGSLGTEITTALAERLSLKVVDKESVEATLVGMGMPEARVEQYDERKPGFWQLFSAEKDRYLHFVKTAIYRFARGNDCIIEGRGGQALFHGIPGVLKVRVIAPLEIRVKRVMAKLSVTEERARQAIQRNDTERAGYHRFFFNTSWEAQDLYDITLNTEALNTDEAVGILAQAVKSASSRRAEPELRRRLDDLCVVQDVITAIIYEQRIPTLFLEVTSSEGKVAVTGAVQVASSVQRCVEVAQGVTGVKSVENRIEVVSYYLGV
jgi:cytidylate kinase